MEATFEPENRAPTRQRLLKRLLEAPEAAEAAAVPADWTLADQRLQEKPAFVEDAQRMVPARTDPRRTRSCLRV